MTTENIAHTLFEIPAPAGQSAARAVTELSALLQHRALKHGKKTCINPDRLVKYNTKRPLTESVMEKKLRPETIIITGTSRLPENVTSGYVYGFLSIDIEIDPHSGMVVDYACTLMPKLVEKILSDCLLGYPFEEGIENCIQKLEKRFFSSTKRAIMAAIEDAYKWYHRYKTICLADENKIIRARK